MEKKVIPYFKTKRGQLFFGKSEDLLKKEPLKRCMGQISLIFTSPPFPLNRKKRYGNQKGKEYTCWLASFAPIFAEYLAPVSGLEKDTKSGISGFRVLEKRLSLQS